MKYNYKNIIIIILLVISIILFNIYTKKVEGFDSNMMYKYPWSQDLIKRFLIYQNTVNTNNNQFNLSVLQNQATPDEVERLLETGFWPWSDDLKYLYLDAVSRNTIVNIQPQFALNYAMKLYNQTAAKQLLAWNTKEGQFLLYGADLGVSPPIELSERVKQNPDLVANVPNNLHNSLKCTTDEHGNSVMKKTIYKSMNLRNGYPNTSVSIVKPEDIPNEMSGFSFVNGPCNPCLALNDTPDYSCPFKLNIKGNDNVSDVWKTLWNI
jgi:hypothetical protein